MKNPGFKNATIYNEEKRKDPAKTEVFLYYSKSAPNVGEKCHLVKPSPAGEGGPPCGG